MFVLIWGKIYLTFVLFPSNISFPLHNFGEIRLEQTSSQLSNGHEHIAMSSVLKKF